jgi:hypothetical protein
MITDEMDRYRNPGMTREDLLAQVEQIHTGTNEGRTP